MIKVGIVGISGYSGYALLKILLNHPKVRVTYVSANNTQGMIDDIWPQLKGRTHLLCNKYDPSKAKNCDLVFLAVPHTVAMKIAPQLLAKNIRIIDISADYRLDQASTYKKWYGQTHQDKTNLKKAIYGLPELYRGRIKNANLVANPGCYPTAALLALAPLVGTQPKNVSSIIIDAKSGVSGAGKKAVSAMMFCEINENLKAYKVLNHQHAPEIELYLSKIAGKNMPICFVPHLIPISIGLLETIYVSLKTKPSLTKLLQLYKRFYKKEPFVRILDKGQQPELKHVNGTNMCDIGLTVSEDKKILVITAAIDNLIKGAAGQAVQNMNIMNNYKEIEGLL